VRDFRIQVEPPPPAVVNRKRSRVLGRNPFPPERIEEDDEESSQSEHYEIV
jgi:hypothetical protein